MKFFSYLYAKVNWIWYVNNEEWYRFFASEIESKHGPDFKITKVWLDESVSECDMCGACEFVIPEVFHVPEKMIIVPGADLEKHRDKILQAKYECPMDVIAIEINGTEQIKPVL